MEMKTDKDFIDTIKDHGLQVTHQRLAIYQTLYFNNEEHPSVEAIYQEVKKRLPMISIGTIYKTLEKFQEVGLIQKVSPISEVARYEAKIDPHHHMVCLKCQSVQDADQTVEEPKVSISEDSRFRVVNKQVILHGYCPSCKSDITDADS
jgi:Fur family peroxide stress response transcriptional regulator